MEGMSPARFSKKVLLVTGGASGIGAATARRFTAEGGRVAIVDIDRERAASLAEELPGSVAITAEASDENAIRDAIASTVADLGGIDCLLTAAGYADFGPLGDFSLERWNRLLAVHATGTFLACKYAAPALRQRAGGSIVTVASVAALVAQPTTAPTANPEVVAPTNNAAYGAAKAAVLGLSRHLARDLAPDHIRVNAIAPGSVRTQMTEDLYTTRGGGDYELGAEWSALSNPQRRVAESDEIAGVACFLFSDDAAFITGETVVCDGGQTVT
jgi:NAD(P)-dependent dehydrogenase (short-subunit alcohol dehydrogenase family)